jgi:hypothetical protein
MAAEKWVHRISADFGEFVGFRRIFQILPESGEIFVGITVEDMLGTKKLPLRAFWEKVPTLRNFETSRGTLRFFKHQWPN